MSDHENGTTVHSSLYRQLHLLRIPFAGLMAVVCVVLFAALITSLGSGTVLAAKSIPSSDASDMSMSDTPNVLAVAADGLLRDTRHTMLSTGIFIYRGSLSITTQAAQFGSATARISANAWDGTSSGIAFAARGIGSIAMGQLRAWGNIAMFTIRMPGKVVGGVANTQAVEAIIRPADEEPLPVIDVKTSAELLTQLRGQQQQRFAEQLATQLAANQILDGSIVAGDPNHGGYPAKWDTVPQDSSLDSWGMYNRECVSYAAWKVHQAYGYMPYWGGVGNANQWVRDAKNAGIPTGFTPKVHSVAISMSGYYGHAMWVEAVRDNVIYVSQYNYDLQGHYSEMWVEGSYFTYIYFQ